MLFYCKKSTGFPIMKFGSQHIIMYLVEEPAVRSVLYLLPDTILYRSSRWLRSDCRVVWKRRFIRMLFYSEAVPRYRNIIIIIIKLADSNFEKTEI